MAFLLLCSLVPFSGADARPADSASSTQLGPPPAGGYSLVAIGDSYTAGVGAGNRITDDGGCRRFDGSYYQQMVNDPDLHINSDPAVSTNMACAGATLFDIQQSQLFPPQGAGPSTLNDYVANADYIVMTGGGNDVGFFWLLNNCVYGWALHYTSCESTFDSSEGLINSPTLYSDLENTMSGALSGKKKQQRLLVLGYPAFWNTDTPACDPVSWYYYKGTPGQDGFTGDYNLTNDRRSRMNSGVMQLNAKIEQAANETPGATYVDVNGPFDGHRFCEDGNPPPWLFNNQPMSDDDQLAAGVLSTHQKAYPADDPRWQSVVDWESPDNGTTVGGNAVSDNSVKVFHPTVDGQSGMHQSAKGVM